MSVKSGVRKFAGGANLTRPRLSVWGVLGIAASVIAILIGIGLGKYLLEGGKKVVGGVVPGVVSTRAGDLRGSIGI